jgi:hypothetical protein
VYLAEQLAKHLREKSGVDVTVHHRELEKAAENNVSGIERSAAEAEAAAE